MKENILKGKTALITGASSGLGFKISEKFIEQGANLIFCSRSEDRLNSAYNHLNKFRKNHQRILYQAVDISKKDEINSLLENSFKEFQNVDILINNAGIIGPKGNFEELDWEEWRYALDTNFLGSAYFIRKLLPHFKKNNYGRIVQISGGGATQPVPFQSIYAASKAAIVRFIETISLEIEEFNITANCIAPGALNTNITDEMIKAGPEKIGKKFYEKVLEQKRTGGAPIEKAVLLSLALSSDDYPKLNGKLISAIWDDWEKFENYAEILNKSDVYTLRRIIAKDRNYSWGDL